VPSRSHKHRRARHADRTGRSNRPLRAEAGAPPTRINLGVVRARGGHFTVSSLVFAVACPIVAFTSYHGHSSGLTFAVAAAVGLLVLGTPALVLTRPRPGGSPAAVGPAWLVPLSILLAALTSAVLPGAFAVGLLGFGAGLFFVCFVVFASDYRRVRHLDRHWGGGA
jgi:hypothetical protein